MSKLQELIERYCPDGVEYKALSEVCFYPKTRVVVDAMGSGGYVSVENLAQNFAGRTGVVLETAPGTVVIEYLVGDILIGNIRPYLKKVWLADADGGTNGDVLVFRIAEEYVGKLLPEFLFTLVASDDFIDFDMRYAKGAKMPRGDKKAVLKYRIPVPPIEVQREIVRLLDAYTASHDALVAKLNEEIELQAKSLATYRETLLTFAEGGGVRWAPLGELGVFVRGSSFQKKHFVDEGEPCIHYGQVHTQFNLSTDHAVSCLDPVFAAKMKRAKPGDLIVATTSEDDEAVGKAIAWMGDTEVVVSNDAYIYSHCLDPMYMAYIFTSDLYQQPKLKFVTGTKVRRVHEKNISKIAIPVPSIEIQREIVRRLDAYMDSYDALAIQLDRELKFRDSQLAEFRNQLLSFPEKAA